MIRAIKSNTATKLRLYKSHIILMLFFTVFVMFFASFFIVIVKNNVQIAKSRAIRELAKNNRELDAKLKDKIYTFKRLSGSKKIRTKADKYNMISPKNQYNIVYVSDSERKETRNFMNVFASISEMLEFNEQTSAKDDLY